MRLFMLALTLATASTGGAQYTESITVERILLDVRVTDSRGTPIADLTADEFEVTIGGLPAEVRSATWVDDVATGFPLADEQEGDAIAAEPARPPLPAGRLVVAFVQTDFAREATRIRGQLGFLRYAEEIVESLEPRDRVAVFSFDSHLKFRLDFTSDKDAVREALRRTPGIDQPPAPPIVPNPALASRLDRDAMRKATSSETALLLLGNALRNIPGPKTLLLLGWGLGQRAGRVVQMRPEWQFARTALDAARVSIFALDTSQADYHDLELGLKSAAKETGGFYAKTHVLPRIAVDRLRNTLAGRYELELLRPEALRPGTHPVEIRVKRRRATVLAPSTWRDRG